MPVNKTVNGLVTSRYGMTGILTTPARRGTRLQQQGLEECRSDGNYWSRSWPRSWHLLYWRPLIRSVVVTAVLDTLDTGEGFGHGRSGLILSAPSGLLHTDSNAPMRSPRGGCYPLAARLGFVTYAKKVHHLEEILI